MRVTCVRVERFWISALHLLVETGAVELEYSREVFPLLRERRACVSCARSHAVRTLGSSIVSVYGRRQAEQLLVQSCGKGTGQSREPKSRMLCTAERPTHDEGQGRVPIFGEVEKANYFGRVYHPRDGEPQPEEHPREQSCEHTWHARSLHLH